MVDLHGSLRNFIGVRPIHDEGDNDCLIAYEYTSFKGIHVQDTAMGSASVPFMLELHLNKVTKWDTVDEDGSEILLGSHQNSLSCYYSLDLKSLLTAEGCKAEIYNQLHEQLVSKNKMSLEFWDMFHNDLSVVVHEIVVQGLEDMPKATTMIMGIEILTRVDVPYEDSEEVMERVHSPYLDRSNTVFFNC